MKTYALEMRVENGMGLSVEFCQPTDTAAKKSACMHAQYFAIHHNFYQFKLTCPEDGRVVKEFDARLAITAVLHDKDVGAKT